MRKGPCPARTADEKNLGHCFVVIGCEEGVDTLECCHCRDGYTTPCSVVAYDPERKKREP